MKEYNLCDDLSKLTTIPCDCIDKLFKKAVWCICEDLEETQKDNDLITSIDLVIGKLLIKNDNNSVLYKFIPSKYMERAVKDTLVENKNPLVVTLEKTLANRIINTYKNII